MKKYYSIDEITRCMIDDYMLPGDSDNDFKNYRLRVYRALAKLNLLHSGVEKVNPETKRKCMYYSEHQRQQILAERTLYDYVRNASVSEAIHNSPRYSEIQRQIQERRALHIEYLDSLNNESGDIDIPVYSHEEIDSKKMAMMIEALFNLFFTPINEDLLTDDLERVSNADDLCLQIEDIEAERRLSNPEGNYYERRNNQTDQPLSLLPV